MQERNQYMMERAFTHLAEPISYTVLATGVKSCFKAIIRKGMEYFDDNERVIGSRDEIDILKSDVDQPKNGDTFVYDKPRGDGLTYRIGLRLLDNGAYTRHIMAIDV